MIGISTDGAAPVFAQAIRAKLEALLPKGFADWAAAAARWRAAVKTSGLSVLRAAQVLAIVHRARNAQPERRTAQVDFERFVAEVQGLGTATRTARSRWSAPVPAIRNC